MQCQYSVVTFFISLSLCPLDPAMVQFLSKGSLDSAPNNFFALRVYKCACQGPKTIICISSNVSSTSVITFVPSAHTHIALLSTTMRITTNLYFILLMLAAGAVALPVDNPDEPRSKQGLSSHTFSPHLFFLFCHTALC